MWQSRAYEYLIDEEIRDGRDPELTGAADDDELRMDFLRPWEVALTCWLDDGIRILSQILFELLMNLNRQKMTSGKKLTDAMK
ncbi:hypothetical protein N7451_005557 [Penicillium sp. IBT 35674x]|nr:hypothetical protein N7451_005557 [Penicillium sp. IBT 35674x]